MSKSRAYVTFATALIDAPDWLMELYRQGRCRGMQELHALRQFHREHPSTVQMLTADPDPITRDKLAAAKAALVGSAPEALQPSAGGNRVAMPKASADAAVARAMRPSRVDGAGRGLSRSSLRVLADLDGAVVEVVIDVAPPIEGDFFIVAASSAEQQAVAASRLRLLRIARA